MGLGVRKGIHSVDMVMGSSVHIAAAVIVVKQELEDDR
jgi:hypothetical protein